MPTFSLVVSALVVAITLAYMLAPPVKAATDRVLSGIRPGQRWPSATMLIVFGLSLLVDLRTLQVQQHTRRELGDAMARVEAAVQQAKDAHASGRLEDAIAALSAANREWLVRDRAEVDALLKTYMTELGAKVEPEIASLIERATAAIAAEDRPKAIGLLTRATKSEYREAPSYVEAKELLATLKPSSAQRSVTARATESGRRSGGIGISLAQLRAKCGMLNQAFSTGTDSATGIPCFVWDYTNYTVVVAGPEEDVSSVSIRVNMRTDRPESNVVLLAVPMAVISSASGSPVSAKGDLSTKAMVEWIERGGTKRFGDCDVACAATISGNDVVVRYLIHR